MTAQDSNLKKARQEERSDHLLGELCVPSSEFYRHSKGHGGSGCCKETGNLVKSAWGLYKVASNSLALDQDRELRGL